MNNKTEFKKQDVIEMFYLSNSDYGKFAREPMRAKAWLVNGESVTILIALPDGTESFRTTSLSRIAKFVDEE